MLGEPDRTDVSHAAGACRRPDSGLCGIPQGSSEGEPEVDIGSGEGLQNLVTATEHACNCLAEGAGAMDKV